MYIIQLFKKLELFWYVGVEVRECAFVLTFFSSMYDTLQHTATHCNRVLQRVAAGCRVTHCVAVCCIVSTVRGEMTAIEYN